MREQIFVNRLLRALCAVKRTGLLSLRNAGGIQRTADNVVTNAGQVLNSSASDKYGRVLLKIVTFAGDINGTLLLVGQSYSRNLSDSRVRLFGGRGRYRKANAALLRAVVQNGRLALENLFFSAVSDELIDCRHVIPPRFTRPFGLWNFIHLTAYP